MIERTHQLSLARQAKVRGISRGSSVEFIRVLKSAEVAISMDGKGA